LAAFRASQFQQLGELLGDAVADDPGQRGEEEAELHVDGHASGLPVVLGGPPDTTAEEIRAARALVLG
jgi:hypothetical protein